MQRTGATLSAVDQGALTGGRPRWRGVLHHWAAWYAFGAGSVLVAMAPTLRAAVAVAIYAVSLAVLFTVSATYHRGQWSPIGRRWMRRLDHAAIFVLIAGTYTPVALLGLGGDAGRRLMIASWCAAGAGVIQSLFWPSAPKPLRAGVAVAVGWTVVPYIGDVGRALSALPLSLIAVGGVTYTLGAVVYAAKRPNPFPRTFGYHEVFHALTLLGAALHFAAVVQIVRAAAG